MPLNTSGHRELIGRLYHVYNARDLETLSALVQEDVDWPDGDRRLHGRAAVRDYWSKQWTRIHTHDEVVGVVDQTPRRMVVHISQVVRDLDGAVVSSGAFEHTYEIRNGLVARMDLRKLRLGQ